MKNSKAKVIVTYIGYNMVALDWGPNKSPRFELWDELNKKSIAKSNNPTDFYPVVYGKEWAERNGWYEIHGESAPKKRRTRKSNQDS